jgi:hypothetical protein
VVSALVKEINAQAGREMVPPFTFTYTLSRPAGGADRELVDLLNVFFPPLGYLTPKVNYVQSTPVRAGGRANAGRGDRRQQFWPSARQYSDRAQLPLRSPPLLLRQAGAVRRRSLS